MSENDRPPITRILWDLQHDEALRRQAAAQAGLDPQLARLRQWQAGRLSRTYADLLADERHAPACRFFLSDIYAPCDFSQRDHDLERIYNLMLRFVPPQMLKLLADSIELNQLTYSLDQALMHALVDQLGASGEITAELYAHGYRLCDNYAERVHQIELIVQVVRKVGEGARQALVGATLRLARRPAEKAGWFELYDFLMRGYTAFRQMRGGENFARTIQDREMRILDRIFANHPEPFEN
jgi:hypothetical protein